MPSGKGESVLIRGLTRRFPGVVALEDVTLSIGAGEFVSLLGPSGCGKTTLLRILAGLDRPTEGRVFVGERDVTDMPPERRPTNLVFQRGAVFPHLNVFDNIAYAPRIQHRTKREIRERVGSLLELVQLSGYESRRPSEISGGQLQRVALARALAGQPSVLLLDEPLSALDLKLRKELQLELRRIHREVGTTFVYVTHDQEEALTLSERIALMSAGRIVQVGSPSDVYDRPASLFASGFIGESNHLRGTVQDASDDAAVVRLEGGALVRVPAGPLRVAEAAHVVVAVRPERMILTEAAAETSTASSENSVACVVVEGVFVGSRIRVRVRLMQGPEAWVEIPATRVSAPPVPGWAARVSWAFGDGRLLVE
jgi:ABC-type Fe3+/spermidine/putrescine transport system ATPase subunit